MRIGIIGGGIVGLATARELVRGGHEVTVLEKERTWAAHQTGRNSGVIHAGPYYRPGSLKARMCLAGNRGMVAFAQEHDIAHDVCGKLIVATSADELPRLEALHERALANGVEVDRIDGVAAREIEPHVAAVGALHVHSTGIIDYGQVSRTLARLAEAGGADLRTSTGVTGIRADGDGVVVTHTRGDDRFEAIVNCAGLQSDRVARLAGLRPSARIVPFRGEYFELAESRHDLVRGLIYPVPDPELPFLGVHLTRMIHGGVHAGPNAVLALAREGYDWRTIRVGDALGSLLYPGVLRMAPRFAATGIAEVARSLSRERFAAALARLVPGIVAADLTPSPAGIRAQAVARDGSLVDDFLIERAARQVHVLNAPSPAATASLEIAKTIAAEVVASAAR